MAEWVGPFAWLKVVIRRHGAWCVDAPETIFSPQIACTIIFEFYTRQLATRFLLNCLGALWWKIDFNGLHAILTPIFAQKNARTRIGRVAVSACDHKMFRHVLSDDQVALISFLPDKTLDATSIFNHPT